MSGLAPATTTVSQAPGSCGRTEDFAFIHWLRGLAAPAVAVFHFYLSQVRGGGERDALDGVMYGWLDLGKLAVAVFFMISGFLVPATLRREGATLRSYAAHRFFRLYPGYWFSLVVFIAAELIAGRAAALDGRRLLVNATMLQGFVGVPDVIGVYWTLQIELMFYAACAGLFWSRKLERWEVSVAVSLAAAMACAWLRHQTGRKLPAALFIALALMFLGDGFRRRADGRVSGRRLLALFGVVLAALVPICLTAYGDEGGRYLLSYAVALAVFAGAFLARSRLAGGGGAGRIAKFLANCSYGVYLLHAPVGLPIGGMALRATGSALAGAAAMLAATTLLAFGMYVFIEAPGIRWGRKLSGRARRDSAPPQRG